MILLKKAMRSIWRGKRSYIACIALMAIGISIYTAFNMLYINLGSARDSLYESQRFADIFSVVRRIPLSTAQSLDSIAGIAKADGRISTDARVTIPGKEGKIITLRILSYDPAAPEPLNAFLLSSGTAPAENEILVGDAFLAANAISAGDALKLVIKGKEINTTVSGGAKSPEYVYAIPDTGTLMPDNEAFGFAYMTYPALAAITGGAGSADILSFMLEDGVKFEDIKTQLEDALAPYGLISLYARKDHASNAMLDTEINSLGSMATSMPMVFILMAVIILYIMLKRVIEQERGSIGTLKAFGFSDFQVLTHYLCYGLITGGLGGIIGGIGGLAMSGAFTQIYLDYFNLPALEAQPSPRYMLVGMVISLGAGVAGAYMGTRAMLKLTPSEAMRPPAPRNVKVDVVGRLPFLRRLLASNGYMAMRNITRSWFRSLFIVLGIAFSFSIIALTSSYTDMFDKLLFEQFTKVQLYDVKVTLENPRLYTDAVEAVYNVGGVSIAEGMLEVPAELRFEHLKESVSITAMESGANLQKIYDTVGGYNLQPPEAGLIISASLARELGAKRGGLLMMKTPYTGDREIPMPVMDVINENLGMTAYCELGRLCMVLEVPKSASAVVLKTEDTAHVKDVLLDGGNVSAVTDKAETRKVYDEMMATYGSMFIFMQIAGMGVAFAIITNTSSISLSERKREYATLRVLGMHPREISKILGFEYWLLTAIGMIPGIPLLRMLKTGMASMMETTMFTIPLDSPLSCYVSAAVSCLVTVGLCNLLAARQIAKFDMVEVLKERE